MRVFGIYLAVFRLETYREEVYTGNPEQVTDAFGRMFTAWTAMSLVCCLLNAYDPWNYGIRLLNMFSFTNAIVYFSVEYSLGTVSVDKAVRPLAAAVPTLLWLAIDLLQDRQAAAVAKKRT